MKFLMYYFIFRMLLGNPVLGLAIVIFIYFMVDRQFIGLLPDVFKPFRRKARIKDLQEKVKLNPADVNAFKELGELSLEAKNYGAAVQYFLKTLDKMGQYADVHFLLGKAYYLQGERNNGKDELEKAIEINEKVGYGEPYVYILEAEIDNTKDPERINKLIGFVERFGTPEILYKAAKILKKYDYQRAKQLFKEALENYRAIPKTFKKIHRRWAFLAKLNLVSKFSK